MEPAAGPVGRKEAAGAATANVLSAAASSPAPFQQRSVSFKERAS